MSRKMVGMSEGIHDDLQSVANDVGVPMTVVIEALLAQAEAIEWSDVKAAYELRKPTWNNIRRTVQEYQKKYPDADDTKLSELTGYSVPQVETVTHTAHKRCIEYMRAHPKSKPKRIADECSVSIAFATRIHKHFHEGGAPKSEKHLY